MSRDAKIALRVVTCLMWVFIMMFFVFLNITTDTTINAWQKSSMVIAFGSLLILITNVGLLCKDLIRQRRRRINEATEHAILTQVGPSDRYTGVSVVRSNMQASGVPNLLGQVNSSNDTAYLDRLYAQSQSYQGGTYSCATMNVSSAEYPDQEPIVIKSMHEFRSKFGLAGVDWVFNNQGVLELPE